MADPYAPPSAKLADQPRPPWAGWKAVLLGLVVDIGGSSVVGAVVGMVYLVYASSSGAKPEELTERVTAFASDPWVVGIGAIPGAFFSVLGGWLCTRLARRSDYRLGLVMGTISAGLGLALSFNSHSLPVNALLTALTFGSVMLGTKLAMK